MKDIAVELCCQLPGVNIAPATEILVTRSTNLPEITIGIGEPVGAEVGAMPVIDDC